ncbi:nesprin-1 [Drosophila busckii]|uniref:nesprin-1 n=1 Tax=Drosophila busckii TaxID=30019 RepID=UPI001432A1BC|nr:nesprin-1 [Drosophila busckii]
MADDPGKHKDPNIDASDGAAGGSSNAATPQVPAVRRRRAHEQQLEEQQQSKQLETATVTRSYMKTVTTSMSSSSCSNVDTPPQRLRQRVEKHWSAEGASKRAAEQSADELRQAEHMQVDYDAENPYDIDVHEIERRLREERQRGLAEAEAAKLAFQQIQLRHTSTPQRVQVHSEQTASPFNVTLRTTSKLSPGAELESLESSPFNVTLRTTRRTVKKDLELQRFLDNERLVREVPAADGVRTIITSSLTSDGGYANEQIYRHGEGYVSPRASPSWSSSEHSSVSSPQSVDMTAGGRRILIKLEEHELEASCSHERSVDETDSSVRARIRQFGGQESSPAAMATLPNIDITVGSNPRRRQQQQTTTTKLQTPQQATEQRRPTELSWQSAMTTTSTPIGTKQSQDSPVSPVATCQLRGSSTQESRRIVSHKTTTTTKTTRTTSSSAVYSSSGSVTPTGNISFTASQIRIRDDIDNDSDTEGVPASSLVIVDTPTRNTTPTPHSLSGFGTFSKSLRQDYQTPSQSNRNDSNEPEQEFKEFQSTMASINFQRSNSQYDSHIKEKREEQERVQKKTFTNWINSYLSKRVPPLRIDDLINDLRDGTKLIALLEVLSGERLPVEKGRVLRRPHFLSNANTALQFLASKRIKLVNINPADLVDGRPPVVLGLIWTIILYFQIEENSRNLEYLGHGIGGSVSSLDSVGNHKARGDLRAEKWKQGAKKTLLNWVTNALPKDSGVEVKDFGASWRDGVAFLALIDAIKANLVNLAELKKTSNRQRLETAFDVAESKLGIAKLLDAEDVDVPKPDEKSIMTYVAQFLHKYPEPKGATRDESHVQQEANELRRFLVEKTNEYEPLVRSNGFPRDFGEYLLARSEVDAHLPAYNRLKQLIETQSGFLQISRSAWDEINELWQRLHYQMMYWLWLLDAELPGEFGVVGKWLAEAEKLLMDNDIPNAMNEETAAVISRKLEEHKLFFADMPRMLAMFDNAKRTPLAQQLPLEQLRNMERRLQQVAQQAAERRIRLKFLEHKCCLIAFLNLVENKMRGWTGKYGQEEKVAQQLEQYKNFVSRNKIFQEFQKAFVDMQQVVDEYKREGNVPHKESSDIDRFMYETEERWKRVSMELKCCQNSLEEVVNCWRNWNQLAPSCEEWLMLAEQQLQRSEDERLEFFQDISVWKDKFDALANAANYLIASCEEPIAQQLRQRHGALAERFERLFASTKQYMHAGDIIRSRQEYKSGIEQLSKWLRGAESLLDQRQLLSNSADIRRYGEQLQQLASELDNNEELFKHISRTFQSLIQDLSRDEVDKMMKLLKQEKESLVRIRAQMPAKLHLINQLQIQQESLEAGQKEIHQWLSEAEQLLATHNLGAQTLNEQLHKHKTYFSRTVYYRSMLESKNKVFQNLLKAVASDDKIDTTPAAQQMQQLNERFNYVIQNAQQWEQRFNDANAGWSQFKDHERLVSDWLSQAESMLLEQRIESKTTIETQKYFFEQINERWMSDLVQSAQQLLNTLPAPEQPSVVQSVEQLQKRWQHVLNQAPLHLLKLEFRLDENAFYQTLKDVEKELQLEQQALNRNEDVDSILQRNQQFLQQASAVPRLEQCLQNMQRLAQAHRQQQPTDISLDQAYDSAKSQWQQMSSKLADMRQTLQQIPAQWQGYHQKFDEMIGWMNSVDQSLKNIVNEVNTMEEFEKEKVVFQKICQDADNKREDMKWLVKTLDSLLGFASESEANMEQKKLEDLIARYKNLIPTIEITMVKTEVFSKCYTYRREVHEVVCLLTKVKDQTANIPAPDSLERVNRLIEEQQYAINQLDHQRPHIMSMLQRGRDLSKDVHAPAFVNTEVKNLETGWTQAYTESADKLEALKGTQAVWTEFVDQKNDIFSMLQTAETELRALTPLQTDPKNVSQDLKSKRDLNVQLQQASQQLLPKLHALKAELAPMAAADKRPILEKEIKEVEKMFFNTMEHVKDRVGYLEDYSAKWNNYKTRLAELQEWANKVAPKNIEALQSEDLTPEERVVKVQAFKRVLGERMKQLDLLAADASELAPKEGNIAEAKRLKGEISKLQEVLSAINRNVDHQSQAVQEDLVNWQQFQAGLQQIKPAVEQSEVKVNNVVSKPQTLDEAVAMQHNAKQFETSCLEQLDKLQNISSISHKMLCKTNAPDELDAMQSRWTAVHENAKQASSKLERLVSNWQSFDNDAAKLEQWINQGESTMSKRPAMLSTPHIDKLEQELVRLKSFNNEISQQQAKLVALGQNADQISLHVAPEGATALKQRVQQMKSKLAKLSELTRGHINEVSDAIISRQDFNAKLVNFSNWMEQLRQQLAQVEELNPERVETSLQVVHALLQEHADKKPSFNAIYDEVKQLTLGATPAESNALNDAYTALVVNYQNLESNLQQKKLALEKWTELLNWKHDTESHLNYLKHQLDKPEALAVAELQQLSDELHKLSDGLNYARSLAQQIDELPAVQLRDALSRKPLIATQLLHDVEHKLENLKLRAQQQQQQLQQMTVRKDKFQQLEQSFGQTLQQHSDKLAQLLSQPPTLQNIDQIIADLVALNAALQQQQELKQRIHDEGALLMREDIASMPAIQESLLQLDKNYETLQHEIAQRIQKYQLISQALREYAASQQKFEQELLKAEQLCQSLSELPRDETQLQQASERSRKCLEQLRRSKLQLDELERRGNHVGKLFEAIGEPMPLSVPAELAAAKQRWQQLQEQAAKHAQLYDAETVIWSQLEDAKKDLLPWLSEMNQSLSDAADNTLEIEFAPMRLSKYRAELPAYEQLQSAIAQKAQQLLKLNNNVELPTLATLQQLLAEQFAELAANAQRLSVIASSFNEQEQALRARVKHAGEQLSKLREQLIKCDDMSGDNAKIMQRLLQCRAHRAQLATQGDDLENIKQQLDELRALYPSFSESIIPKELSNVAKRYEGVESYGKKIEATLLQFLKKFHADKVGMLKRLIATQKEKVAWCQPETSSDKYNLDVKKSSLLEVAKAIDECAARHAETLKSLEMLQALETPEALAELHSDAQLLQAEMTQLQQSYAQVQAELSDNVELWAAYEQHNEQLCSWLRDAETRVKAETAAQLQLAELPSKLQQLTVLQSQVLEQQPQLQSLERTAAQLMAKNPEARIAQFVQHLQQRYQTVNKTLAAHIAKVQQAQLAQQQFGQAAKQFAEWQSDAKIEFQELARMGSPGSSSATAQQLQTIKRYVNSLDNGQLLLNNALDIADTLYAIVTPEQRELLRAQLRQMREQFDYLRDEAHALMQQVEGVLIQKTSIEESYSQVSHYLSESVAKLQSAAQLYATLAAKKSALQQHKTQLQEITLHKAALQQLHDKAVALCDDESERKTEQSIAQYSKLAQQLSERIATVAQHVAKHESYEQVLEKAQDWLNTIKAQALDILNENAYEKEGAEEKLAVVENLLQQQPEGDAIFASCQSLLDTVLSQTHTDGHAALLAALQSPKSAWDAFMLLCQDSLVKLKQLCCKWNEFDAIIAQLSNWLTQVESVVKNQSLKSTAAAKQQHLQQLQQLQQQIVERGSELNALLEQAREIDAETDLNLKLSRLHTRYQTLTNACKEACSKYVNYVKDHAAFDADFDAFKAALHSSSAQLAQTQHSTGDHAVLQQQQQQLRDMCDARSADATRFESLIERGEKLYAHTSPDGRELIRQQLRALRSLWDNYTDDLTAASQQLEHCLLQFNEFSVAQEQLSKWLKDVDKAMQSHTEPKTTLQEKRAQLQNHKLLHQEISNHHLLVDNVCDKAQLLLQQIKDNSLQIYLDSIKQLFQGIVAKSADILANLEHCVQQHSELNAALAAAKSWLSNEKTKLLECDDAYGERADIKRKLHTLQQLAQAQAHAAQLLSDLSAQHAQLQPTTSDRGNELLAAELTELQTSVQCHFDDIEGIERKLQEVHADWLKYEATLEQLSSWCRAAESVFREQPLQSTLHEKVEQLEKYKIQRELLLQQERQIDAFGDMAHALLNSCGAERLKTHATQLANRYQLLQVLSKEVVNRWCNLVDEHQLYQDKYNEVDLWLQPIEAQLEKALLSEPAARANVLQLLLAERERAEQQFAALNAAAEKALPETSTQGREKLRKQLRDIRERWDQLDERIRALEKQQQAQTVQLSSYQDILTQLLNWLEQQEKQLQLEQPASWTSAQEIRSKIYKYKAANQDIASHKRVLEAVSEKAAALNEPVVEVNARYERLAQQCAQLLQDLEAAYDVYQQFSELQKAQQDYQKNLWDRLAGYSDYSGNKAALQARLQKLVELQDALPEGSAKLKLLQQHIAQQAASIPARSKENMTRDAANLQADYEKFAGSLADVRSGLEQRLQQWQEYELNVDRLISWLSEAENSLKNYNLRNSYEEKEQQLQLFQALTQTLRQNEADFEQMKDQSSELVQSSGETRIAVNVQQVSSRFQSIQATAKEILKKCEQAVQEHAQFNEKYKQAADWLAQAQARYENCSELDSVAAREELLQKQQQIQELLAQQPTALQLLNSTVELGEKCYSSTASEGRDAIRAQLDALNYEQLYDNVQATARKLQDKLAKWCGFDETAQQLDTWLSDLEQALPSDIELRTTLDEKRSKLQNYRDALNDINNHQLSLANLQEIAANLPEQTPQVAQLAARFAKLQQRANSYVERYECIVSAHQHYSKAVMEAQEFMDATQNTVHYWGDLELEQMSLHTNLDRLRHQQASLADEFPRVDQVRALGEKVIPGTVQSGQVNIKAQIDSTQQEWESLLASIAATIEAIEARLAQWAEYEQLRDCCLAWLRDTDNALHAIDLKESLCSKRAQLEQLKSLQGEVRAKELEVDNVTEKAQTLLKSGASSRAAGPELVTKYQQIFHKVKDLHQRWQQYVASHADFDNSLQDCSSWIAGIQQQLQYCADQSSMSQKELDKKLSIIQDVILLKDEGCARVLKVLEQAQHVLANTAPAGHEPINRQLAELQQLWSDIALRIMDVKAQLDDSITQWSGFLDQVQTVRKFNDWLHTLLQELGEHQTTMTEKRAQLDRVKSTEEKVRVEKIDVDALKLQAQEMIASGQQSQAAYQAQKVLDNFDALYTQTQKLLSDRQDQHRDHRLYKEAYDDLVSWISRAREKFPALKQSSLSDKLAIENAVQATEALLNKQAQGELLVEHLVHTGEVVLASTSTQGQEIIRNDIRALRDSFESLFREINQQKESLEVTMVQWRAYKEEYERLMEWLQQIDILVKNHKLNLCSNLPEKQKQVQDMRSILERLENGKSDIDKFHASAAGLLKSHLDSYVNNQLRHLSSVYQVQVNLAKDVLKKVETNCDQHAEYDANMQSAQQWIANAKQTIQSAGEGAGAKEALQRRLEQIQQLIRNREAGQNLVHTAINNGEKIIRNTRSDGRDAINSEMKELQTEWDRLVKKMSNAKVQLETNLLQWADYSSSYTQLQQWITDREAKLQQACEQKIAKSQRGQPGLSSGLSERKANLRQTNNIVQDIVSFEPMIQSVASKASDLQQGAPASEISDKYESLTKQAKQLYDKQKNTIDSYQALIDAGNEFASWLRNAKERLSKCSEPTGDKQALAEKTHQLKILQGEVPEGAEKLKSALTQGEIACRTAEPEDCAIIEEEVALLQEEFDSYVEALNKAKDYLEVGIVKWSDYQEQYTEALEWLTKTETLVQSYNKLQDSLTQKKIVLEEFQGHLQTLFDWQKTLDHLNMKAQLLLETCSDTRISNAIMQLTTKYNALLTLAKEVMRRLELHYQEHQQHHTLYEECQSWIENTREKLAECEQIPGTLSEVQIKLNTVKNLRQGFETGQNKLRYLLELKEKVIMNTEQQGALKVQEDTETLKQDFEKLLLDLNEVRQQLANRLAQLEEIFKLYKLLLEWLEDVEPSVKSSDAYLNDLSEKRAALEKFRVIQRDINGHTDIVEKIQERVREDASLDSQDFQPGLARFEQLQAQVNATIESLENQVNSHEKYKQAYNELQDWLRRTRIDVEQCADCHGEKEQVEQRLNHLGDLQAASMEGKALLDACVELSQAVIATSGNEGQDNVAQEIKHLTSEWETMQSLARDARSSLEQCLAAWQAFLQQFNKINLWIVNMSKRVAKSQEAENKTTEDLAHAKKLLEEVLAEKETVEDLNDNCELLMEQSACTRIRDQTIETQANYTKLLTSAQGLVAKIEKNLSDHTEFLNYKKEMDDWIERAQQVLNECSNDGDAAVIAQKLETVNSLSSRLPEGQHLLAMVQDAYSKASNITPEEKQEKLRELMTTVREDWDALGLAVKEKLSDLKQAQHRWIDFAANRDKLDKWLSETEQTLKTAPQTKGELSEMKTLLERYKTLANEIKQKATELEQLQSEARELGTEVDAVNRLQSRCDKLKQDCAGYLKDLEQEMLDYNAYHQNLQDVEKWLLQISFQLMAHNSLFISNREQTQEQIKQHEALLSEIQKYQTNLDDLNAKGQAQIKRYESSTPSIRPTVESQLHNIQESYNSLLQTSVQIKNRLLESLAKFQEYEDTLDNIMRNLETYEPIIQTELDAPATSLELAQSQLKCAQDMQQKLNNEKARLAAAVQACEAATASISRPSSPLETAMHAIPERELIVRSKLEDLLDQVQSHLGGLTASVSELEQQQKHRAELQDWVKKQQSSVSDWLMRPCKLRPEAAQQELVSMNDLLNSIGDKRSQLMLEMTGSLGDEETDLDDNIDKLESELMDAIAKKQAGQNVIEGYRQGMQDVQNWFDSLIKRMDVLDRGSGLNCAQKMAAINEIRNEYELQGHPKIQELKGKAAQVAEVISNLDGQQVEEQMKSLDRRFADLGKRIERKVQLLDVTNKGVDGAKAEIDQLQKWVKQQIEEVQAPTALGFTPKDAEARQQRIKSLMKDAEAKQSLADVLEKRIANMQSELEPAEHAQLESALRNLNSENRNLCTVLKSELERALDASKARKALENDLDKARQWLKSKISEVRKLPVYHPLSSAEIEKKIQENRKYDDDAKQFNDSVLSDVQRQAANIMKDCGDADKAALQKMLDELAADYQTLKEESGKRGKSLDDLLQGRQGFESAMKQMNDWLNEMETATECELRTTSLPVLEEQLTHYKKLLQNAQQMGGLINDVSEQGKSILPTLSNADKLKLNDDIKSMKDRYARIKQTIDDRNAALAEHIKKYKDAKNRLADCSQFLGSIQQRLRELNRPIGSRIEDVQDLLGAYEGILKELKDSKSKMGDMQMDDLPELQSILAQQDDMIKLIEDQLAHLRQLLLLREQFIALINEIIAFIMKYTDVIIDIENSPDSLEDKINKYDNVIVKIQECEGLLASAYDKGQKIASEGNAADKNSITEQLQSLKNQLQNLRKAVESQRQKHQLQLESHKKMAAELSDILDWQWSTRSGACQSTRPALRSRYVESGERELAKASKHICRRY